MAMWLSDVAKTVCIVAVPLIAVALLAGMSLHRSLPSITNAYRLSRSLERSKTVRHLLTALQRERGMTCVYLEMLRNNKDKNNTELYRQILAVYYNETDDKIAIWLAETQDDSSMRQALLSHRKVVGQTSELHCNETLQWYTNLHHQLLREVRIAMSNSVRDTNLAGTVAAYHKLLLAKDYIGLTRAIGGNYVAHGGFDGGVANEFAEARGAAAVLLELMGDDLPAAAELYSALQEQHFQLLDNITSEQIKRDDKVERNAEHIQQSMFAWWQKMTDFIDTVVTGVENKLMTQLEEEVEDNRRQMWLIVTIAAVTLVLFPLSVVIYVVYTQRLHRINRVFGRELFLRTKEANELRQRSRQMLSALLPKKFATTLPNELIWSASFEARTYPNVAICMCDVVGFAQLVQLSSPSQIVRLVNSLHATFDALAEQYDCFKFDRNTDASAVFVSGLSKLEAADLIPSLALDLLKIAQSFAIPFLHRQTLVIRAGIHTGHISTGILGNRSTRFCLFGETVETAQLMESIALGMTIAMQQQLPMDTYNLLGRRSQAFKIDSEESSSYVDENNYWKAPSSIR